ncbi:UNVERIFIED_CONTAM: hypothetical protein NCL1_33967 [Trichonephila clavipes]
MSRDICDHAIGLMGLHQTGKFFSLPNTNVVEPNLYCNSVADLNLTNRATTCACSSSGAILKRKYLYAADESRKILFSGVPKLTSKLCKTRLLIGNTTPPFILCQIIVKFLVKIFLRCLGRSTDICSLPRRIGYCNNEINRWYYDSESDGAYGSCILDVKEMRTILKEKMNANQEMMRTVLDKDSEIRLGAVIAAKNMHSALSLDKFKDNDFSGIYMLSTSNENISPSSSIIEGLVFVCSYSGENGINSTKANILL